MTDRNMEKARYIAHKNEAPCRAAWPIRQAHTKDCDIRTKAIVTAIKEARAEEREACAEQVEKHRKGHRINGDAWKILTFALEDIRNLGEGE